MSRFGGEERARLAAVMLLTLRGTPFVYYGEEIGMSDLPEASGSDPEGRDRCRAPMPWSDVQAQDADPTSMLSLYRRLIWLRRGSAALQVGEYRPVSVAGEGVFVFERTSGAERMLVALNFGEEAVSLRGASPVLTAGGRRLVSTHLVPEGRELPLERHELRPFEAVVFEVRQL